MLICKFDLILNWDSFKEHLILSQGSSFICKYVPYPTKLLWYCWVSGNATLNKGIVINAVRVEKFCKIEIDSHRDGDDRTEQDDHTHRLYENVLWLGPLQEYEEDSHKEKQKEEQFWQEVNLQIYNTDFSPCSAASHRYSSFCSYVHHQPNHCTIR